MHHMHHEQDETEILKHMSKRQAKMQASLDGDMEGQGVVLQEAQATGLPVVATRHNGFPDSVVEGKSALLVPEKNIRALTDAIEHLVKHPQKWPTMGRAGRKHVEANFERSKTTNTLTDIYRELIEQSEGTPP